MSVSRQRTKLRMPTSRRARKGPARAPTPFELLVYAVVRRIPTGEVRSYQWVAKQLGRPRAGRAVGQALNRNPWPMVVPCHRVVQADGGLGGFAWGPAAKRRLLRAEQRGKPAS